MKRILRIAGAAGALIWSAAAAGSDWVGIYAVVDKVVLEPSADKPERVQVQGVFALAKDQSRDEYATPVHGYLYYSLPAGQEQAARAEWADLAKVAGTGECVAFLMRHRDKGRIRSTGVKPRDPEPYAFPAGVTRIRQRTDYSPIQDLIAYAVPVSPAGGAEVEAGKATLTARNILDQERKRVKYVFEIESAGGKKETSPEIEPGKKETRWSPQMAIREGESYTWRVRASEGDWKGPEAVSKFIGRAN